MFNLPKTGTVVGLDALYEPAITIVILIKNVSNDIGRIAGSCISADYLSFKFFIAEVKSIIFNKNCDFIGIIRGENYHIIWIMFGRIGPA